ncbi:UNVERIFIED_CONTAM: Flavin mononucleotide hydrolase 1, chloroplatic [Sesamum indicum]
MAAQRLVGRFSSSPMVKLEGRSPSTASKYSTIKKEMSLSLSTTTAATAVASSVNSSKPSRKLPVLLFDIMDTIVRDPFYHDVPAFFGMSMKELLECKHPTAWIEFEKGLINENVNGDDTTYFYKLQTSGSAHHHLRVARSFFVERKWFGFDKEKGELRHTVGAQVVLWVGLEPLLEDFRPVLCILCDGSLSCSSTSEDNTDASVS